jgi:hypothetical protein
MKSLQWNNVRRNTVINSSTGIPNEDERLLYEKFEGDLKGLSSVDYLLFHLSKDKRLSEKIKTLMYMKSVKENVEELKKLIQTRMEGSTQLRESEKFHKLLELILIIGNTLNKGKRFGNAKGFKLDILTTLVTTKSSDGTISLLDYLISIIDEKNTNIRDFYEELTSIPSCSRISFDDIKLQMDDILKIQIHLMKESTFYSKDTQWKDYSNKIQDSFLELSEVVQSMQSSMECMKKDYEETIEYYGDDMKRKDVEIFKIVSNFIAEYKKSFSNYLKKNDPILTSPRSARLSHSNSEMNLLSPRSSTKSKRRMSARINMEEDEIVE